MEFNQEILEMNESTQLPLKYARWFIEIELTFNKLELMCVH